MLSRFWKMLVAPAVAATMLIATPGFAQFDSDTDWWNTDYEYDYYEGGYDNEDYNDDWFFDYYDAEDQSAFGTEYEYGTDYQEDEGWWDWGNDSDRTDYGTDDADEEGWFDF